MALAIEDYALIGDCETAALVGRDGSIDWLCWPRFDSPACFAALLGTPDNGRWLIAPAAVPTRVTRRYRDRTLILETDFETEDGAVTLIDFMPVRDAASRLIRIAVGRRGAVPMRMELVLRFDYGRLVPWVSRTGEGSLRAVAGPHSAILHADCEHHGRDFKTVAEFTLRAGERRSFSLSYRESHLTAPAATDPEAERDATEDFWRGWAARCAYQGPWAEAVIRSLITIKALIYRPTGGMVAAPTTSLPEQHAGTRNWDYRFCWLRDATFAIASLLEAGFRGEAGAWRDWLLRAVAGMPSQVQPIYGIAGEHRLEEWEPAWLCGHNGASPVRIGNAASNQFQLDVFGEVLNTAHLARSSGLEGSKAGWDLECALASHVETVWREPDNGIWEVRGGPQLFTHSRVLAWVAIDRAIQAVEQFGHKGPLTRWRALRSRMHAEICRRGFDAERNAFVQAFGSPHLDAGVLMIPIVGFLPAADPRMVATVRAIERELMSDGFVLRYDTRKTKDGLPAGEGVFLPCSFWLAENYALANRRDDAEALFERLLGLRNDVGLLAEEYDPHQRTFLGNFPQALSHLSLVNTAMRLSAESPPRRASLDA